MRDTRLNEWLKSMEGRATTLIALGTACASLFALVLGWMTSAIKLTGVEEKSAETASTVVSLLFLITLTTLTLLSYRRFATASRLLRPEQFTLTPNSPETLIGRKTDLDQLLQTVKANRIVLLDGESGCGKSALLTAGLKPCLLAENGLLPILIRDLGSDWERDPLSAALGALHEALSDDQRMTLKWVRAPDLAASAEALDGEFEKKLDSVDKQIRRTPLLIVDQFDDYQFQKSNRQHFLDETGNWLRPEILANRNRFWKLVRKRLLNQKLHLLAVTRADMASGFSCLRFLGTASTVDRKLYRVEMDQLALLLEAIAPANAQPAVVEHPDRGWKQLRERLEQDLRKSQDAILMQQLRTVLLGLRQLPVLRVSAYERAGGLHGVESLVIGRAIRRAAEAIGSSPTHQALVRKLLGALVMQGGVNQPPKAQGRIYADLLELVGDARNTDIILDVLQKEGVARPAHGTTGEHRVYQLDHDYLAKAVQGEAKQADRWNMELREHWKLFHLAGNSWQQQWTALLPVGLQARLAWEGMRGRLRYGETLGYARLSAIKPLLGALMLGTLLMAGHTWNRDRALTAQAVEIYERFGRSNEAAAVLEAWRAPEALRTRLFQLVQEDNNRLASAVQSKWLLAHGGLDNRSLLEAARLLREFMMKERNSELSIELTNNYASVVTRISDPTAIQLEATALRERLARETNAVVASSLAQAYATVAARLSDPTAIQQAATALREQLERENNEVVASALAQAYATVAARLSDPTAIQLEATALRERLVRETDLGIASSLARAYATVAAKLADPTAIQKEATALRERLVHETDSVLALTLHLAYATVVARLSDPTAIQLEATALRERLVHETNSLLARTLAEAYATVAARLSDPTAIQLEATALRERLVHETASALALTLHLAYATVAARLSDQTAIQQAATALRERLVTNSHLAEMLAESHATLAEWLEINLLLAPTLAQAYATVAARLSNQTAVQLEATALREQLEREASWGVAPALAEAYATIAARLSDPTAIQQAATALREQLEREASWGVAPALAQAYATVAARLSDPTAIQQEATALRERLERETDSGVASRLAQTYATVAARLSDPTAIQQEANTLRERLERETGSGLASALAQAYATVAARLSDPTAIQQAANTLRERLERETDSGVASSLAQTYATVAARLSDPTAIQQAATALREQLERETNEVVASSLAQDYATVAARLSDPTAIQLEATALRERLVRETDSGVASSLAQAYATISTRLINVATAAQEDSVVERQIRELLIMTTHPLLHDAEALLAVLTPVSERDFNGEIGAAVDWWATKYKADPASLRPLPQAEHQADTP